MGARYILTGLIGGVSLVLTFAFSASAWSGPTATAPSGNVSAPINVGTTDSQVKNGGLSVNAFAAFGSSYFAGNVGIGITNPSQKLVVTGNTWLTGNLIVQNGNVGIGTANPAYALTVTSGNKAISIGEGNGNESDGRLILGWTSASGGTPAWANMSSYQNGYKKFLIEAAPLVLNSNGNYVGIGTVNPTSALDINQNVNYPLIIRNTSGNPGIAFVTGSGAVNDGNQLAGIYAIQESSSPQSDLIFRVNIGANTQESMRINYNNYVGIGTSDPQYRLDVAGTVNAGSGYYQTSDRRFKDNIAPLGGGLQTLLKLTPVSFIWNMGEKTGQEDIGFIAQDVEEVIPEAVKTGGDGIKSMDYTKIVPVLVKALQEQQKEIEELKTKLGQ